MRRKSRTSIMGGSWGRRAVLASRTIGVKTQSPGPISAEWLEPRQLLSSYTLAESISLQSNIASAPQGGVVMDSNGDLFATAVGGGASGVGSVFEVPAGSTTPMLLGSFTGNGPMANGDEPQGRLLLSNGTLYGTGTSGGAGNNGVIFSLTPGSGGINDLYAFTGISPDGANPTSGLVMDSNGNFFGTTSDGGANGEGTLFELASGGGVSILSSMSQSVGANPAPDLIMDASGNLYGIGESAGPLVIDGIYGAGQIFELAKGSSTPSVLASFNLSTTGYTPIAGMVMDSNGDLFGTTSEGGTDGGGTIWELASGSSTITPLASFDSSVTGNAPDSTLVLDSNGDLFGTTTAGGADGRGTVFELVHGSGTITPIFSFNDANGSSPRGQIVINSSGDIFGATSSGGANSNGTVFELAPAAAGAPAQLAFGSVPTSAVAGSTLTPAVTVDVEDANGNVATTDTSSVTLSIGAGPSGAVLGGTVTEPAVGGVATFSNLTLNLPSTDYTLTAIDGSLASATSTPFAVSSSNGGGGGAGLSPTIISSTVPTPVVGGAKVKGTLKVGVTNASGGTEKGFTINVYAAPSTTLDTSVDTLVKMASNHTALKVDKGTKVSVPITQLPSTAGSYYLIVQTVDSAGNSESVASSSPVVVAAPFITLAGTLGAVNKIKSGDTLKVTNNGNVADDGSFTATIGFSTDPAGADPAGQTATASKNYKIAPGKSISLHSTAWAKLISSLTPGTAYYLTVLVTDSMGNQVLAVSPNTFTD